VTPSAHVGHWLADMLYVLPLLVMAALVLAGRVRERRQTRRRARRAPEAGG
jgi:cytochrome c oxidase assembly factor CtaG